LPFDPNGGGDLVAGEALLGHVAHGARDRVVAGEAAIVEELAPERDLRGGHRVVRWHRNGGKAERRLCVELHEIRLPAAAAGQALRARLIIGLLVAALVVSRARERGVLCRSVLSPLASVALAFEQNRLDVAQHRVGVQERARVDVADSLGVID